MNKLSIIYRAVVIFVVTITTFVGCSFLFGDDSTKADLTEPVSNFSPKDESNVLKTSANQALLDAVPSASSVRRNLGLFTVPGISLTRWQNNKDVAAWRDTNQPLISLQPNDDIVHDVGVSKNGAIMASVGAKINIWDLNSLTLIRSWSIDSIAREIKLTPDGKTIVTIHDDNKIRIWQQETGFNVKTLSHKSSISAVAISSNGSRLASSDSAGNIYIWDTKTGKRLYGIDDALRVKTLNFSLNGLWLASSGIASDDINHTVQIWETRYFTLELSLPGHRSIVNSVDFSPDGQYLVTASRDNTIRIWDGKTGSLFKTLKGHTDDVVKTVFSNDGYWLISSSLDNKIRIWSFPDGRTIKVLQVPYLKAQTLEYVDNRNWIVLISGNNQVIQIWASSGFTYKPWADIRKRVGELYKDRQKILTVPFIPKPQLPSIANLKKGTFESQLTFVDRISKIYGQKINNQIIRYRKAVDDRNRQVAVLRQNQNDSRKLVNQDIRKISIRTTRRVLGETVLFPLKIDGRPAYDPDRQLMTLRVSFTRSYYREDLILKMPEGKPAEVFYKDLSAGKVIGNAVFEFISDSRVRLSKVNLNWRGRNFMAFPIKRSGGFRIIPSELRNVTLSSEQLQFQRYDIPYTNFNDFIRAILREHLKRELQSKGSELKIDRNVKNNLLSPSQ